MNTVFRVAIQLAALLIAAAGPLALAPRALAQPASAPSSTPPVAAAPAVTPEKARDLLETLNDPRKRAAFTATLNAMLKAAPAAAPAASQPATAAPAESHPAAPTAAGAPSAAPSAAPSSATPSSASSAASPTASANPLAGALPLAPDSLGARLLVGASGLLAESSARAEEAFAAMNSLPSLWGWLVAMTTNPWGRDLLIATGWRLALVFGCGIAAQYAMRLALRRPRAGLAKIGARQLPGDLEPDTEAGRRLGWRVSTVGMLRRLPLTLARLLLDLLPMVAFLLVAHLVLSTPVGDVLSVRLVLIALVAAYALCIAILACAHALFAPEARGLRLFDMTDAHAAYAMRWSRRLVVLTVFGYAIGEAGRLLGLSEIARQGLMKAIGLGDHILLAIIVLQQRRAVRDWIMPAATASGMFALLRKRAAQIWHWIALFYLAALWLVWAVEIPDGFSTVLRLFVLTTAMLVVTRIMLIVLRGTLERVITPRDDLVAKYPDIAVRMRLWRPVLHVMVDLLVYLATLVALLQIWGIGAVGWLIGTSLGLHVVGAGSTILLTLLLAMVVWEAANHGIERHLARLQHEAKIGRSARLRTLLPMLRSSLLAVILVVVALLVLSEFGLNIAPLLAGAGVLGIAIGFGSQKLVQDVITGLFLLLENTVQVGDVVSVSGLSGVVEDLSIRTIHLRSEDGSIHVIPFSAVTTVTNMTRDYSKAVINVGVAYKEDFDHVAETMRCIAAEMRAEPRWETEMRGDLEVVGLDSFADSAIMIKATIRCGPSGRWPVLREFNRRMKLRFDREGIEMPFPQRSLIIANPGALAGAAAAQAAPGDQPLDHQPSDRQPADEQPLGGRPAEQEVAAR